MGTTHVSPAIISQLVPGWLATVRLGRFTRACLRLIPHYCGPQLHHTALAVPGMGTRITLSHGWQESDLLRTVLETVALPVSYTHMLGTCHLPLPDLHVSHDRRYAVRIPGAYRLFW